MRDEYRKESLRDSFPLKGAAGRVRHIACEVPLIGEVDVNTELGDRRSVDRRVQSVITAASLLASSPTSSHLYGFVVICDFSPALATRYHLIFSSGG